MSKTKLGLQGNRTSGKIYQTVCVGCEWKSEKSPSRSQLKSEGLAHKLASDIPYAKSKHKIEMRRVEA